MTNTVLINKDSDVTVVITSCNRFPLLAATLSSFITYNTYPIKKIIIVEDSGSIEVQNYIPKDWQKHCVIIVNNPKLGQIKSIDLAYTQVDTEYIFHCEDDWVFYRSGFIEESLAILRTDPMILQVWLRSFENDIKKNYSFHYLGDTHNIDGANFSILQSSHEIWQGFSLNPGLRRLHDYRKIAPFSLIGEEAEIAIEYKKLNFYSAILSDSAIEHIGWEQHITTHQEKKKLLKRTFSKKIKHISIGFIIGILVSIVLYFYIRA